MMASLVKRTAASVWSDRPHLLVLALVLVGEIALGVVLGLRSTTSPQAYDADYYGTESLRIAAGDGSWLAGAHNYLYPAFLAALHTLGFWDRLGVGVVQIGLLYVASFTLAAVLSRCLRVPFLTAGVVACGIAILPAAAWSGYWLSEGLAAPVLLFVIALWVLSCYRVLLRPGALSTAAITFGLGLASGSAWMTRPALIWVPIVVGLLAVMTILAPTLLFRSRLPNPDAQPSSRLRPVGLIVAFMFGLMLSLVPQLALDPNISHLLKLDLAGLQAQGASTIWRYSTNLSSCGPPGLVFSPLSSDTEPLKLGQIAPPDSVLWRLTTSVAHLVSGWDPRPTPTYATSLSNRPWVLVTLASGFVCAAPLLLTSRFVAEIRRIWAGWRVRHVVAMDMSRVAFAASVAGLLVFFGVTQWALMRTATEFRFNLMGWLSGGACLVSLTAAGWLSRDKLALYVVIGATISLIVLIIGQMTLDYSAYWLQCSR
jgi:hypothetical protein